MNDDYFAIAVSTRAPCRAFFLPMLFALTIEFIIHRSPLPASTCTTTNTHVSRVYAQAMRAPVDKWIGIGKSSVCIYCKYEALKHSHASPGGTI